MKAAGVDLDITQEPNTERKFTMVLVPHCVHYNQLTPSYDEFYRATQVINPYAVITEELTNEAWRAVFECRVELGKMTRIGADRASAAVSSLRCRTRSIQHLWYQYLPVHQYLPVTHEQ